MKRAPAGDAGAGVWRVVTHQDESKQLPPEPRPLHQPCGPFLQVHLGRTQVRPPAPPSGPPGPPPPWLEAPLNPAEAPRPSCPCLPAQAPAITNRPHRHWGPLKHLLTNSFSLSLDFLQNHLDTPQQSIRGLLTVVDSSALAAAEKLSVKFLEGRTYSDASCCLEISLRQRSPNCAVTNAGTPNVQNRNTSGTREIFFRKISFFWEVRGPERVRPGGWEWVCSRPWRPDLGLAEDATAAAARRRPAPKQPGAEKAAPGPSQGQALLLLDFTMILQYCRFVTNCIRHWPTFHTFLATFAAGLTNHGHKRFPGYIHLHPLTCLTETVSQSKRNLVFLHTTKEGIN